MQSLNLIMSLAIHTYIQYIHRARAHMPVLHVHPLQPPPLPQVCLEEFAEGTRIKVRAPDPPPSLRRENPVLVAGVTVKGSAASAEENLHARAKP
jgi:hypothetical protein